jgi:hypothetical protein
MHVYYELYDDNFLAEKIAMKKKNQFKTFWIKMFMDVFFGQSSKNFSEVSYTFL